MAGIKSKLAEVKKFAAEGKKFVIAALAAVANLAALVIVLGPEWQSSLAAIPAVGAVAVWVVKNAPRVKKLAEQAEEVVTNVTVPAVASSPLLDAQVSPDIKDSVVTGTVVDAPVEVVPGTGVHTEG